MIKDSSPVLPVAIIVTSNFRAPSGGIQYWCVQIADLLSQAGFKAKGYGLRDLSLKSTYSLFKDILFAQRIIFGTWKHVLPTLPIVLFKAGFLPRTKQPVIQVLCHGDEFLCLNTRLSRVTVRLMFRCLSATLIANSTFTAQLVKRTLNVPGVRVARPIVSPPRTESPRLATSRAHPADTNNLNLLTVSRLVARKNIRTCLNAVHALRSRGIDLHYTVAGVGPDLDSLQCLARNLDIDDVTQFLGEVTDATKYKLLASADIFLLPSVQTTAPPSVEGYGIAFIEANYHGCPVISGNSGGMPEAVLDRVTGIITDGSTDEVTAAIIELLETTLDRQRIKAWALTHSPHANTDIVNMLSI